MLSDIDFDLLNEDDFDFDLLAAATAAALTLALALALAATAAFASADWSFWAAVSVRLATTGSPPRSRSSQRRATDEPGTPGRGAADTRADRTKVVARSELGVEKSMIVGCGAWLEKVAVNGLVGCWGLALKRFQARGALGAQNWVAKESLSGWTVISDCANTKLLCRVCE